MALKKAGKRPTHLEVTTMRTIVGPEFDEKTGRKEVLEPGTDCKMPFLTARRLAAIKRVAITPEDRAAARKAAKKSAPKDAEKNGTK
jgi:hypothetical protein